jgi:hypothetical protein
MGDSLSVPTIAAEASVPPLWVLPAPIVAWPSVQASRARSPTVHASLSICLPEPVAHDAADAAAGGAVTPPTTASLKTTPSQNGRDPLRDPLRDSLEQSVGASPQPEIWLEAHLSQPRLLLKPLLLLQSADVLLPIVDQVR